MFIKKKRILQTSCKILFSYSSFSSASPALTKYSCTGAVEVHIQRKVISGKFSSSELHKHGARLNIPVDDAKAARWKALAKKLNPNVIL